MLGGGIVRGSVVLLAGEPGVGKSTLTLQTALVARRRRPRCCSCAARRRPQQVKARAARLGADPRGRPDDGRPAAAGRARRRSSQRRRDDRRRSTRSRPSSTRTSRRPRARCRRSASAARGSSARRATTASPSSSSDTSRRKASVAGPRVLEHLVDVVLNFEGDRSSGVRILRALKNRFGSTQEVGFFEMTSDGLFAIRDASAYPARRPLHRQSRLGARRVRRRTSSVRVRDAGADPRTRSAPLPTAHRDSVSTASRLPLIVAVLEKHCRCQAPSRHDVYVSAVGGIAMQRAGDRSSRRSLALMSSHLEQADPARRRRVR